jgi:hypothetical protein
MRTARAFLVLVLGLSTATPSTGSAEVPPSAPVSAAAPAPVSGRALTRRKCTGWAAGQTTETRDVVFRREKLVQRATEEVEITYQAWDVDDALDANGADEACRAKARAFCARYTATGDRCRFQVHEGLESGGWPAAAVVDPPPARKTAPRKRARSASAPRTP